MAITDVQPRSGDAQEQDRRAVVYVRISRDVDDDRLGVERQRHLCQAICERHGLQVIDIYEDNDVSATSSKPRPEYQRMLGDLRAGVFGVIVALDSDRLLRKLGDLAELFDLCETHGVRVKYESGGFDPRTGDGMFEASIRASVDAEEVRKLRKRVRRKSDELANAGKVGGGGWRPSGYSCFGNKSGACKLVGCPHDGTMSLVPAEAEFIREGARRIAAGEALRGVISDQSRRGFRSPTGREWSQHAYRRMILSPRIAGLREHRGAVLGDAVWPAIVDRATWEAVRRILTDPARRATRAARRYLLTGLLRCGLCDAKLVARPRADGRRCQVCATGVGFTGCGKIRTLSEPLEELVQEAVILRLDGPRLAQMLSRPDDEDDGLTADLNELERRLDEADRDYADEVIDRRAYMNLRGRYVERRDALLARLAVRGRTSAVAMLGGSESPLRDRWAALSFDQKRAVLAAVIDHVVVGPAVKGRNFFDPSRVNIVWRA